MTLQGLLLTFLLSYAPLSQRAMVVTYVSALDASVTDEEILRSLPPEAQPLRERILEQARRTTEYVLAFDGARSEYYYADLALPNANPDDIRAAGKDPVVGYYYDAAEDVLMKTGSRLGKAYLAEGSGKEMAYKFLNEQKTILGYTCLRADTEICGKSYTVYYTPEIPAHTGPERFVGLPGLVLQVVKPGGKRTLTASHIDMVDRNKLTPIFSFVSAGFTSRTPDPQSIRFADLCGEVDP